MLGSDLFTFSTLGRSAVFTLIPAIGLISICRNTLLRRNAPQLLEPSFYAGERTTVCSRELPRRPSFGEFGHETLILLR